MLFNQIFISITYSSGGYWLSYLMLGDRDMRDVSSFPIMMRDLLIAHQCFDSGFFFFHKIMHSKYFYKRLHKIHHEWKAPICITALYAHPTGIHQTVNLISVDIFYKPCFRTFNCKSSSNYDWPRADSNTNINSMDLAELCKQNSYSTEHYPCFMLTFYYRLLFQQFRITGILI